MSKEDIFYSARLLLARSRSIPLSVDQINPFGKIPFVAEKSIAEALKYLVEPTPDSLYWAMENDEVLQAMTILTSSAIHKALNVEVEGENEEIKEKAKKFLEVFHRYLNVSDFIEAVVWNLLTYGNSVFLMDEDVYEGVPVLRLSVLDFRKIKVEQHPYGKWLRYVYTVETYDEGELPGDERGWVEEGVEEKFKRIVEKRYSFGSDKVLHFKILSRGRPVGRSPIAPALTFVVYKKLILYYMVGSIQIYASPIYIAKVGDPERLSDEEYLRELEDRLEYWAEILSRIRYNNNLAVPPDVEVQIIQPSATLAQNYREAVEILDKKIFLSVFGSPYLVEARGTELATSRTILEVWREFIAYMREKITDVLERDLYPRLLEMWGIPPGEVTVKVKWVEKKTYTVDDFVKMVQKLGLPPEKALEELGYNPEEFKEPERAEITPPEYGGETEVGGKRGKEGEKNAGARATEMGNQ